MKIFRKKNWYEKKVQKWTGRDMVRATGFIIIVTTAFCSLPIIGCLLKEKFDS